MRKRLLLKYLPSLAFGGFLGALLVRADEVGFWLYGAPIALVLILVGPLTGKKYAQSLWTRLGEDPSARVSIYAQTIASITMLALGCVLFLYAYGFERSDYGLNLGISDNFTEFVVLALASCALLAGLVAFHRRAKTEVSKEFKPSEAVLLLLPRTGRERIVWAWVSLAAGVGEEIAYRGFLTLYFYYLTPDMPMWLALTISSVAFGLTHAYQGRIGVLYTTALGALFAAMFWLTESLLLPIVVHTLADLAVLFRRTPADASAVIPDGETRPR